MEIQEQVKRLNEARAKAQRIATEGSRLEGVLASAKKRKDELEQQCLDKFDCKITGLADLVAEFEGVAEKELAQAEAILNATGTVESDEEEPVIDDEEPIDDDDDPDGPLV